MKQDIIHKHLVCIVLNFSTPFVLLQANEGPVKESGQPEAQRAAGKEPKHSADGGGQEARGQSERNFPAD